MPWLRFDQAWASDVRVMDLSDPAMALLVAMICDTGMRMTDGRVARSQARRLRDSASDEVVAELVAAGFVAEDGDTLLVVDWRDHLFSKEEYDQRRAAKQKAGRKGGLASGRTRREASASAPAEADAQAKTKPVPNRTEPKGEGTVSGRTGSAGATPAALTSTKPDNPWRPPGLKPLGVRSEITFAPGSLDDEGEQ